MEKRNIYFDANGLHISKKAIQHIVGTTLLGGASLLGISQRETIGQFLASFGQEDTSKNCLYSTTIEDGQTALIAFQKATGGETHNDKVNRFNLYKDAESVWLRKSLEIDVPNYSVRNLDEISPGQEIYWTMIVPKESKCPPIKGSREQ